MRAAILFASFLSTAALSAEPVLVSAPFRLDDVSFVKKPGRATVAGSSTLKLGDGSLKSCAGFPVELLPVTAYSSERIRITYGNTRKGQILRAQNPPKFTPDVKEYHDYLLKAVCDAQGRFRFEKVPAGEYFIMAFILWDQDGGAVMHRIRVGANDNVGYDVGAGQPDPRDESVSSLEAAHPELTQLIDGMATVAYRPEGATVIKKSRGQLPKSHPLFVKDDMPADDVLLLDTTLKDAGKVWVLFTMGPSMDPGFYLVRQEGLKPGARAEKSWAEIPGTTLAIPDDGRLFAASRANSFYTRRSQYRITAGEVREVPQPLRLVGLKTTALKPLTLYSTRGGGEVLAELPAGAPLEVLASDDGQDAQNRTSYLARTASGLAGWIWVPFSQYQADTVDGITYWGD